jgi:LPXTG-motif cell wall-anchored protein
MAQDQGNYTNSTGVQDSSYLKQDLMVDESAKSANTSIIILVILIIVLIAVFYYLRKKKKK